VLVDSGASASCILDKFTLQHSLPCALRNTPSPVTIVDGRPIASGYVTHDMVAPLNVNAHDETLKLAVVTVQYPVILGLDWLRRHNPKIDWQDMDLKLDCCNLQRSSPVMVVAQGFGPRLDCVAPCVNSGKSIISRFAPATGTADPNPPSGECLANTSSPAPLPHTLPT
jgi:hypothetical protein